MPHHHADRRGNPLARISQRVAQRKGRQRRRFVAVGPEDAEAIRDYGAYVKTSRTEARVTPGPRIGQDNDFVFKELLQLPEERYRQFVEEQVIY